jgi:uncharacterized delta-60 repeat protein
MKKIFLIPVILLEFLKVTAQSSVLDTSFGKAGSIALGIIYDATAFDSEGRLIGVTMVNGGFVTTRYSTRGVIDPSFGNAGTVTTVIPYLTTPSKVLVASEPNTNKIVVQIQGASSYSTQNFKSYRTFAIARLNSNGSPDTSFATNGLLVNHEIYDQSGIYYPYAYLAYLAVNDKGDIATARDVSRYRQSLVELTYYSANETVAWSKLIQPDAYSGVAGLTLGSNGDVAIFLWASGQYPPYNFFSVGYLYNSSGVQKASFGYGGGDLRFSPLSLQDDGKVLQVVGGYIIRYNSNGFRDSTFGNHGAVNTGIDIKALLLQSNGKLIAGGGLNGDFAVARFTANGKVDPTFGISGRDTADFGGNESIVNLGIAGERLMAYGSGILAAFWLNNGCTAPTFSSTVEDASCGLENGTIHIIPTSGVAPFVYSIDGGKTTFTGPDTGYTFNSVPIGKYTLYIRDANGCESLIEEREVKTTYECLPKIVSFSPMSGPVGSTVTITGSNFDPVPGNNIVYFGAVKANVTAATSTSLTVIVPIGATYQPITVTAKHATVSTATPFVVTFTNSCIGFSANSFVNSATSPTANIAAISDLDGDGKADIISGEIGNNTLVIYRNIGGNGTIAYSRVEIPIGTNAGNVRIADLNADGKPDIAFTAYPVNANYTTIILKNTSTNGVISFVRNAELSLPSTFEIADFDTDGKPDIAAYFFYAPGVTPGPTIAIARNTSSVDISFDTNKYFSFGTGSQSLIVSDFNVDARPDIALSGGILRNTSTIGNISFVRSQIFFISYDAIAVDLNVDGKPDLITRSSSTNFLNVYKNVSTGDSIALDSAAQIQTSYSPKVADLNGDGKPEVIVNRDTSSLSIFRNISTASTIAFAANVDYATGRSGSTTVADFDEDGKPDIQVGRIIMHNQMGTCSTVTMLNDSTIVRNASCGKANGNLSIIPTTGFAPFMYSIDGGVTYVAGPDTGYTFVNLGAGLYKLRLKDATGQESEIIEKTIQAIYGAVTFLNNGLIILDATCANNDGNINIIPTSGAAPFMYSINGGTTYVKGPNAGYGFQNLPSGTYKLRLKDANGCESETIERVVKLNCACLPPTFVNNALIILDATCANNDGNINIIPTSGSAPFMYSINGGATYVTGPDAGYGFQNLPSGTYKLRLKDGNGCESAIVERQVKLLCTTCTPPTFVNNGLIVLDASCGKSDGAINIIPTSGTPPFMNSINGGATYVAGPNAGYGFQNLRAGTYQLRLKDSRGCESAIVERTVRNYYNCPGVTVSTNTSEAPLALSNKDVITTYPNPNSGQFKLLLQNFVSPKAEVSIYDAKGTLIQKRSLNLTQNTLADFDLKGKAAGLYLIKVVTASGINNTKVLVQ